MAILILTALYLLAFAAAGFLTVIEMSNEMRLLFNIVGGVSVLVLPIIAYSAIDLALTRRAVRRVGINWCSENDVEYSRIEIYKNHFSLMYSVSGKNVRKKFRVHFF